MPNFEGEEVDIQYKESESPCEKGFYDCYSDSAYKEEVNWWLTIKDWNCFIQKLGCINFSVQAGRDEFYTFLGQLNISPPFSCEKRFPDCVVYARIDKATKETIFSLSQACSHKNRADEVNNKPPGNTNTNGKVLQEGISVQDFRDASVSYSKNLKKLVFGGCVGSITDRKSFETKNNLIWKTVKLTRKYPVSIKPKTEGASGSGSGGTPPKPT